MTGTPWVSKSRVHHKGFVAFGVPACLSMLFCGVLLGCAPPPPGEPAPGELPPEPNPAPTDIWFEIDYSAASTVAAPAWTFSDTAGWSAADWAWQGKSAPEVWDGYNSITVGPDAIGTCALLVSAARMDVRIGLNRLVSCGPVVVRLEGRSASVSSPVVVDVSNPLNGVGTSGSVGCDWSVHVLELDLGQAVVSGADQAIRVEPSGGSASLALARLRVTLHDATW